MRQRARAADRARCAGAGCGAGALACRARASCGHLLGLRVESRQAAEHARRHHPMCTAAGARPCTASAAGGRCSPDTSRCACGRCAGRAARRAAPASPATWPTAIVACSRQRRRPGIARRSRAWRRCGPASTARRRRRGRPSRHRRPRLPAPRSALTGSTMSPLMTTGMRTASLTRRTKRPVGLALEELAARARVHGDERHAGGLGAARQLGGVDGWHRSQPSRIFSVTGTLDRADAPPRSGARHGRGRASAPSPPACRSPRAPGSPC